MSPPIIQYWDRDEIPDYIADLLATFAHRNPDLPHLVFNASKAVDFIATRFTDREVAAFRACAVPAMQADYFRYCALVGLGGLYSDADFRCVGSLAPLLENPAGGHLFHADRNMKIHGASGKRIVNGLLAFGAPHHPLPQLALELVTANIEQRIADTLRRSRPDDTPGVGVWLTTGPGVLTAMHLAYELGSLDALLDVARAAGTEPLAMLLCDVVARHDRLVEAFQGVHLSSIADCKLVQGAGFPLPYKATKRHWVNVEGSIYR